MVDLVTLGADHAPLKRYGALLLPPLAEAPPTFHGALLFPPLAETPPTFQALFMYVPCFWNNFLLVLLVA